MTEEKQVKKSVGEELDLSDLDRVFNYTLDMAFVVVKAMMKETNQSFLSRAKQIKIAYNALKTNFTIEQIWERMQEQDKNTVLPLLRPEEIAQLKAGGYFKAAQEKQDALDAASEEKSEPEEDGTVNA
jgi:hypothetical protein